MDIKKYVKQECVAVNAVVEDKEKALQLIASIAKRNKALKKVSEEEIFNKMLDREKLSTTGFGNGIAIPHCAIPGIEEFVIGILTLPQGVDFAALDKKPVKLIVFIVLPEERRTEHVRVLSRISNSLKDKNNIKELLSSKNAAALVENFLRQTYLDKDVKQDKKYNQFTITVQYEEYTESILNILAEIPDCYISVIEADNAGKYLYNQPLFTNLWSNEAQPYHVIISAVAKKSISNEIIRKINSLIDDNDNKPGILMTVQNLFYVNGSLDV